MHCERAHILLFDGLDTPEGKPADPALQAHLDGCADCRAVRDEMLDLQAQARVWHELSPPPWNPAPGLWQQPAAGTAAGIAAGWRVALQQWFPPLASAAALLLAAGLYWQDSVPTAPVTTVSGVPVQSAASATPVSADNVLAASRQERQQELAALTALLKAEMDRRSMETEESLKYIISHQIQSQRQLEAIRGRLAPEAAPTPPAGQL